MLSFKPAFSFLFHSCQEAVYFLFTFRHRVVSSAYLIFSSVQFSRSVVSDSLWPHELQHARPLCPSPTPGVHSNSHSLSRWCHPAISSSVIPFSSCSPSLPASASSPMSQLFAWGGQSTGVSALASFPPRKSQGWSPSEWTGWISLNSCNSCNSYMCPLCLYSVDWRNMNLRQDFTSSKPTLINNNESSPHPILPLVIA